ncbi:29910_t:CDS:2, partial [Racocetra persica]
KEEEEAKELQRKAMATPKNSKIVIPGRREPGVPLRKRGFAQVSWLKAAQVSWLNPAQ